MFLLFFFLINEKIKYYFIILKIISKLISFIVIRVNIVFSAIKQIDTHIEKESK